MTEEVPPVKRARLDEGHISCKDTHSNPSLTEEDTILRRECCDDEDPLFEAFDDVEEEYQRIITSDDLVLGGEHYLHSNGAPPKHNYNLRWYERLGTSGIPSAAYSFEITYTAEVDELFFTSQWQYLPFSISRFDRYIAYCVVKTISSPISSIVSEGDIILKVNSQDMVQRPTDATPLQELSLRFQQTQNNTRVVRFLRVSSHTHSSLSAAEILLHLEEKSVPARFLCKPSAVRGSTVIKPVLESSYIDAQLPPTLKKLLQGQRINWQAIPNLPVQSAHAAAVITSLNTIASTGSSYNNLQNSLLSQNVSSVTPLVTVHALEKFDNKQHRNVSSYNIRSGIYRDRGKFTVIYSALVQPSIPTADEEGGGSKEKVLYNLGRYDNEEEAAKVLNDAKESTKASGGMFIPRHYLLGYRAPAAPPASMAGIPSASSFASLQSAL